jgi:arylsulfatase A-like enzyme
VIDNETPFPPDSRTFASLLGNAGYRTGYVGKWHMGTQTGPRPGFDHSASYVGHGRYFDAPFEIDGVPVQTEGFVDDVATDRAIAFMEREGGDPFALVVGFKAPHGPRQVPPRLQAMYADERARPVPNADEVPPFFEVPRFTPPSGKGRLRRRALGEASDKQLGSPKLLDYFRLISSMDENVGRLLASLDDLGLRENTVVIFSSDNGFYLGEHSLGGKCSAYEESIRIPLLVHHPRLGEAAKGRVIDEIALNIDLAPTLLELAGASIPGEIQGRSWGSLLRGVAAPWRSSFFYQYSYTSNFPSPAVTAVRTQTAKLIRYPGHEEWTEVASGPVGRVGARTRS